MSLTENQLLNLLNDFSHFEDKFNGDEIEFIGITLSKRRKGKDEEDDELQDAEEC